MHLETEKVEYEDINGYKKSSGFDQTVEMIRHSMIIQKQEIYATIKLGITRKATKFISIRIKQTSPKVRISNALYLLSNKEKKPMAASH